MRFLFPISTLSLPVLSLSLLLYCSIVVDAFVSLKSPAGTATGTKRTTTASNSRSRLYYDIQRDPQPSDNVWAILSNTEKWISQTLADAQIKGKKENPLSRKEVSYVCETSKDPAMILANIFRKVKEARQLGESHGQDQEELIDEKGGTFFHIIFVSKSIKCLYLIAP